MSKYKSKHLKKKINKDKLSTKKHTYDYPSKTYIYSEMEPTQKYTFSKKTFRTHLSFQELIFFCESSVLNFDDFSKTQTLIVQQVTVAPIIAGLHSRSR